jgi:hypothetical protein
VAFRIKGSAFSTADRTASGFGESPSSAGEMADKLAAMRIAPIIPPPILSGPEGRHVKV